MVLTETESGFAVYPSVDRASFPVRCPEAPASVARGKRRRQVCSQTVVLIASARPEYCTA
ncbi:hypothetical protein JOD53_001035 [Brevibacterium luteolum]|nr:hypothetical protein [Brevibacterium luteolum]